MYIEGQGIAATKAASGELLLEMALARCEAIMAVDATFRVDVAVLRAIAGPFGVEVSEKRLLACLPDKSGSSLTLAASLARVEDLRTSSLYCSVARCSSDCAAYSAVI